MTMTRAGGQTRTLSAEDFAVPISDRYFEDYRPGATYEYGYRSVTGDEIIGFAQQYDPSRSTSMPPTPTPGPSAASSPAGGIRMAGLLAMNIIARRPS